MASKGRWKGRARFTAMRDALIFIYGNRLYARNHPRPIYSGGDGGSDSIGALVDARGDGRAMVTSAGGDGDGVVVCRVNGVGCHLTFLVG